MAKNENKQPCAATNVDGSDCKSWAMPGSSYCSTHLKLSGQTTKLTPELQETITALVRSGNYTVTACVAAGISEKTFHDWMRRGDPDVALNVANLPYIEFRREIDKARATGEAAMVRVVAQEARDRTWQAAVWFLERAYPERWSRPSQREDASSKSDEVAAEFDPFKEFDELAAARREKLDGA